MGIGTVTLTQANSGYGGIEAVERKSLWIGVAPMSAQSEQVHALNSQTDLDAILGAESSVLKANIQAAILNAGSNFTAYVVPLKSESPELDWASALAFCLEAPNQLDVELVVITDVISSHTEIGELQAAATRALSVYARHLSVHAAVAGISADQTWSEYLATTKSIQADQAADRVCLVPLLHGNDLGVVIGRLCHSGLSLGDSPMRVASGPVVGLGPSPVDSNQLALTAAHWMDLAANRFSVPQSYPALPGMYWSDHMTLAASGSDFQVFEHVRIMDYLSRRIRVLMTQKIADRSLNQSASSVKYHEGYFAQPLLDAAKGTTINGQPKPGLIQPVQGGDVQIIWKTNTEVDLFFQAAPWSSPKKINGYISLDLNRVVE